MVSVVQDPALDAMYLADGLPMTARYEHFSLAFTRMVVYHAGCGVKCHDTDYDGVDITITESRDHERFWGPEFELQLKCTTQQGLLQDDAMTWRLKAKPYRKLTRPKRYTRAYLGVLLLPEEHEKWLSVDENKLVTHSRMYWQAATEFAPLPDGDTRETVTVRLPRSNVFDGTRLLGIMKDIGDGEEAVR